jgi:hypothetical protein
MRTNQSAAWGSRIGALAVLLFGMAAAALADSGVIAVSAFPTVSVADGRSTVTISATIRDKNGRLVPDGTLVLFTTSLGTIREPQVTTSNGIARAVFVVSSIPGVAKISATAMAYSATTTLDYELVSDRGQLSSTKEYIEVVAPKYLMYGTEERVLGAAGPNRGVQLRFREIEIDADDLQLDVPTYQVRARNALLVMGKVRQQFGELYLKLNERRGVGTTSAMVPVALRFPMGRFNLAVPVERERFSVFEVDSSGIRPPKDPVNPTVFEFIDLSESPTTINAKKVVAFPRREVHFHSAEIFVGGAPVLKLPLFQVNLYAQTPILTEQIVNVYDNQLSVNYPHYLSLKPGQTSLLRLRFGDHSGRGFATSNGLMLDYELNWNRGDHMEGGLVVSGLGRNDWGVGVRQYYRLDDRTVLNAQLDFPAHQSYFGSASVSRQFDGFHTTLSANHSRSIEGQKYENETYSFVLEKDPIRLGALPFKLYLGLTSSQTSTRTDYYDRQQTAHGVRARLQMNPLPVDSSSTVNASLSVSKLQGTNTAEGLTYVADVSYSKRFGNTASAVISYNLIEDGFTSEFYGRQALSFQGYVNSGRLGLSVFGSKSLDLDRLNYYVDGSFRISSLWRLSYSSTFYRYLGDSYSDNYWMLAFRLGARDIGIVWSQRTKRFGLQVLGAPID